MRTARTYSSWAAAFGGAIAVNALLAAMLIAALTGVRFTSADAAQAATAAGAAGGPELANGCVGNALLAAAARYATCYGPWQIDADACLSESENDMWIDLSSCAGLVGNPVEIAMLAPKQRAAIPSIDPESLLAAAAHDAPKPKVDAVVTAVRAPPPPPPSRQMQVVETVKPAQDTPPDHARYVSEYNTRTDHETVARGTAKEPMVEKPKPGELEPKANPRDATVNAHGDTQPGEDAHAPDAPGLLAMREPGALRPLDSPQDQRTRGVSGGAEGPAGDDGYMAKRGDGAADQQRRDRSDRPAGQGGAGGGGPDAPNLRPSPEVLERAVGGGSVDHVENVDDGDSTSLNSVRWIYASFFNRMKRQVAQNWDPVGIWRRDDPTGQVYGWKTRVTEVRVSLTTTGALEKIVVVNPSGVGDLDDEAVRAFHAAAPFPNPPKELAGRDDLITFGFSFTFEIGHSGTTAWYR